MIKGFTTLMAFSQGHPGKMIRKTLADHWDNDHEIAFEKIRLRGSLVGWWLLSPPNLSSSWTLKIILEGREGERKLAPLQMAPTLLHGSLQPPHQKWNSVILAFVMCHG